MRLRRIWSPGSPLYTQTALRNCTELDGRRIISVCSPFLRRDSSTARGYSNRTRDPLPHDPAAPSILKMRRWPGIWCRSNRSSGPGWTGGRIADSLTMAHGLHKPGNIKKDWGTTEAIICCEHRTQLATAATLNYRRVGLFRKPSARPHCFHHLGDAVGLWRYFY